MAPLLSAKFHPLQKLSPSLGPLLRAKETENGKMLVKMHLKPGTLTLHNP